jgi:hypothetical protein
MIDAWYEHDIFELDIRREEGGGEVYITRQGNLNLEWNLVASGMDQGWNERRERGT